MENHAPPIIPGHTIAMPCNCGQVLQGNDFPDEDGLITLRCKNGHVKCATEDALFELFSSGMVGLF